MMLNAAKLGFYLQDEASKESKLIAEYHIILKSDGRLNSGKSFVIIYRFNSSAQSVTYSLRTGTVECTAKP